MAFLDSTIIIDYLKGLPEAVQTIQSLLLKEEKLKTTLFNYYEVFFGELAFGKKGGSAAIVPAFLESLEIVFPSIPTMQKSAEIRLELQKKGKLVGNTDLFIAGIVISNAEILYTKNAKHFLNIPGLQTKQY